MKSGISYTGRNELALVTGRGRRFVRVSEVAASLGIAPRAAAKKLARWSEEAGYAGFGVDYTYLCQSMPTTESHGRRTPLSSRPRFGRLATSRVGQRRVTGA